MATHYIDFVGKEVTGFIEAGAFGYTATVFSKKTGKFFEKLTRKDEKDLCEKIQRVYYGPIVFSKAQSRTSLEDVSALRAASDASRREAAAARRGQVSTPAPTFESQLTSEELEKAIIDRMHTVLDQSDFFQSAKNVGTLISYLEKICSDQELPSLEDIARAIRFLDAGGYLETSESGKRGYILPRRWGGETEKTSVPETQQSVEKKLRAMPLADLKKIIGRDRKPAKFVPPLPPLQL